jgi:Cytochrome C oxidase, cbb3-type, subunit III
VGKNEHPAGRRVDHGVILTGTNTTKEDEVVRRVFAFLAVLVIWGAPAVAQEKPRIERGTIQQTSASNGKEMFISYCAACHGPAGKGDGPAAAALTKKPADLTKISARAGGTFPTIKVSRFIEGEDQVAAHGSRDMPIWGSLFKSLNTNNPTAETKVRVYNLTEYLKSIQQ